MPISPPRFLFLSVNERCDFHVQPCGKVEVEEVWKNPLPSLSRISPTRQLEIVREFAELSPKGSLILCGQGPDLINSVPSQWVRQVTAYFGPLSTPPHRERVRWLELPAKHCLRIKTKKVIVVDIMGKAARSFEPSASKTQLFVHGDLRRYWESSATE